jgi:hypothetical protein
MSRTLSHIAIAGLLLIATSSLIGCKIRTDAFTKGDEEGAVSVDELASSLKCGKDTVTSKVRSRNGLAINDKTKFATAMGEANADGEYIWFVLTNEDVPAGESAFSIRPNIIVSLQEWPKAETIYPVVDDCFEPRRTENKLSVCGDITVKEGKIRFPVIPEKTGGAVVMDFQFSDDQDGEYNGVSAGCVVPPASSEASE